MFCVDCGKDKPIFREGSCLECYLKRHQFSQGPPFLDIPVCAHCGSFKYKSLWTADSLEHVVARYVRQLFTISAELKQIDIHVTCTEERERFSCAITISGTVDDASISETHHLYVRLKQHSCDVCSKQFGGYHEAILQIRPYEKKIPADELLEIHQFVETLVTTMQQQGHRNLFIADVGDEHGGIDFYLSDKQAGATIIKKVQERYGGVITTSSKNVGMKDSKQLYRVTYLIRLPSYRLGEFLEIDDEYFYISSLSHHTVHLINLATWEKRHVSSKDLEHVKVLGGKERIKEMILVSQTREDVQVMEPNNYKIMVIKKPQSHSFDMEKIRVVFFDEDTVFLFPFEKQKG